MREDQKVYIIVATDKNRGIGKDGKLPWHFKKEMEYFRDTTMETFELESQNMVIMGRKTWESLPEKFKPLPGRKNVVVSRNPHYEAPGATAVRSLGEAFKIAELDENIENLFVIGGAQIYELAVPVADGIYLTEINNSYDCDTFFPDFSEEFTKAPEEMGGEEENGTSYSFKFYSK